MLTCSAAHFLKNQLTAIRTSCEDINTNQHAEGKNKLKTWNSWKKNFNICILTIYIKARGDCKRPCFDQLHAHILDRQQNGKHSKMCVFSWSKHGRLQFPLASKIVYIFEVKTVGLSIDLEIGRIDYSTWNSILTFLLCLNYQLNEITCQIKQYSLFRAIRK